MIKLIIFTVTLGVTHVKEIELPVTMEQCNQMALDIQAWDQVNGIHTVAGCVQ